jgi:hypothetical protein
MVNFMAVTTVVLIRAEGELRLVYNTQRVKLRTFIVPFPPPNLPTAWVPGTSSDLILQRMTNSVLLILSTPIYSPCCLKKHVITNAVDITLANKKNSRGEIRPHPWRRGGMPFKPM